jgi:hypothetical protein
VPLKPPCLTRTNAEAVRPPNVGISPDLNPYKIPADNSEFLSRCRIRTGAGFAAFALYDYQRELSKIIANHSGVIIIKDRQLGITEFLAGDTLAETLRDPAYSAAFISTDQKKTGDIQRRTKLMPRIPGLIWERNNGGAVQAKGCGSIDYLCSTPRAARGLPAVNRLCFDEAGFIDKFEEVYGTATGSQESVPEDRRKTILCTTVPEDGQANPVWGMFASNNDQSALNAIRQARAGESSCGIPGMIWWTDREGWAKVIIGRMAHPVYGKDPDYINNVIARKKIPRVIAEREYNLGIEQAGSSLFSPDSIDLQSTGQWLPPINGARYLLTVDPNFGGSDNYVGQIWDITDPIASLAAEYAESGRSTEYSRGRILALADHYKVVALAIESNSGGKIIYENICRDRPDLNTLLTLTTANSKKINTDRVALALEQGEFIAPKDWAGWGEMRSFSSRTRCAVGGEKDDRIMAMAAGWAHLDEVRKIRPATVRTGRIRR